jgi:hypothetical protein
VDMTVKITPRVAAGVARRLKLAARVHCSSMSELVNDALDKTLPSLEEIRQSLREQTPAPRPGEVSAGTTAAVVAAGSGPVTTAARDGRAVRRGHERGAGDGSDR